MASKPIVPDTAKGKPYMTPQEASDYLRCSVAWLQKMRAKGAGPAYVKVGAKVFYREVDLQTFVKTSVVKPTAVLEE